MVLTLVSPQWRSPDYLTADDYDWLGALLSERQKCIGQKLREWRTRCAQLKMARQIHQRFKFSAACTALERITVSEETAKKKLEADKIRALVFRLAAKEPSRQEAINKAASILGVSAQEVGAVIFQDIGDERQVGALMKNISVEKLALLTNFEIVSSIMRRAQSVRVKMRGQVRAIVRQAKLLGLLCVAQIEPDQETVTVDISGPYSLFKPTPLYGWALSSLITRLKCCDHFLLIASCVFKSAFDSTEQIVQVVLVASDPLPRAAPTAFYDSEVEARFSEDFRRVAPVWEITREPPALTVEGNIFFPDFALRHRQSNQRWWLEIVGYWTPQYVQHKIAQLKQARIKRLIICLNENRACRAGAAELLELGRVVRYRRRIEAQEVLTIIEEQNLN